MEEINADRYAICECFTPHSAVHGHAYTISLSVKNESGALAGSIQPSFGGLVTVPSSLKLMRTRLVS